MNSASGWDACKLLAVLDRQYLLEVRKRCLDATQYLQCEIAPMRVPQRNFVVEFKSRSRQPKVGEPASIWGDTDLKAVARQVEEQSADIFAPPADEPIVVDAVPPEMELQAPAEHTVECPAAPTVPEAQLADIPKIEAPPITLISTANVEIEQPQPAEQPSIPDEAGGKANARRQTKATLTVLVRRPKLARVEKREAYVSLADLDALEQENQRLKVLLRQKLAADNSRLRQMLTRFS